MKKRSLAVWIMLVVLVFALCACQGGGKKAQEADKAASGKMVVYASFYPMYDFAKKIGGDRADVYCMVPSGTEPHDWEPTPSDMTQLEEAAIFVFNGNGMEHWVDKVQLAWKDSDLRFVEASAGIEQLEEMPEHSAGDGHHDSDPHVWLNPIYAKQEMEKIKEAYAEADPTNADYYEENYQKYAQQLDELDAEFSEALSLSGKRIVVQHEAFGYLCDRYGLTQVGVQGLAEEEPSLARMAEIVDFIKENGVKVIFFEELTNSKVAQAIADETDAECAVLNPLEGVSEEQMQAGEDYFSIMRQNLEALKKA